MRSKAEAQTDLKDFHPMFRDIVATALTAYVAEQATLRHKYGKGTEAAIINDYIRGEARRVLGDNGRVKIVEKGRAMLICVDGYVVKPKKLDARLRTRSIPTRAVESFLNQQAQLEGMPPNPTNLFLGYQRNDIQITMSPIFLVCPDGRQVEWDWPLVAAEEPLAGETPMSRIEPKITPPTRVKPKIQEKPTERDKAADDKEE